MMRNARLSFLSRLTSNKHFSSAHITKADKLPWNLIGDAKDHLVNELEELYWIGVTHELESVLFTLRAWQAPQYQSISLEDEADDFIHGFDTFVDQVSEASHDFADEVAKWKSQDGNFAEDGYLEALRRSAQSMATDQRNERIKAELRQAVEDRPSDGCLQGRVRLLLQAVGFLDIEKMVEHRPPLDDLSFWKRPAIPQLRLDSISNSGVPTLSPMQCSHCSSVIRGSMYRRVIVGQGKENDDDEVVCEDCYREKVLGTAGFVKVYKHCILREAINPRISRQICLCDQVPHHDASGKPLNLFPVDKETQHLKAPQPGSVECRLLKLPEIVAEAKYDGMQSIVSRRKGEKKPLAEEKKEEEKREASKSKKQKQARRRIVTQQSQNAAERSMETGTAVGVAEAEADEDVPFFLKRYTERYPFGNVHMALRVGPLVLENGVAHTQRGALITLRECPVFYSRSFREATRSLALDEGRIRQLWWQKRSVGSPKRFKSTMKQVIGSPFTRLDPESAPLENRIIDSIISASKLGFDDPGLSRRDRQRLIDDLLAPIISDLKDLMRKQVSVYMKSIALKLLDPDIKLTWSPTNNNCQNFCDSILDLGTFGSLLAPCEAKPPLYLMSFACRPAAYSKPKIRSKFDVPRGLTEEYLLRFRYGRHDDADIVDTLHEYWYDWGAFGQHLYRYQKIFPWDCTEAFGRYPITCGDCNLAKHVWAFPFDSWSIIALHLTKDPSHYQPDETGEATVMPERDWMKNRLLVLSALEKLTIAATEMARNASFRKATSWLHTQSQPALDRLKLGGIHRAQPFSHSYDQGKYHHFFTASWAHLRFEDQVTEYEALRDGRVKLPDVEYAARLYHDHGAKIVSDRDNVAVTEAKPVSHATITDSGFNTGVLLTEEAIDSSAGNCSSGCGASSCTAGPACSSGYDGGDGGGGDSGGGDGGGGDGCGGDGG